MNAYLTAIDVGTDAVLWRSAPLVANADTFEIIGDRIVTGYGFTAEPDWLYVLDRGTGAVTGGIPLASGPEFIMRPEGTDCWCAATTPTTWSRSGSDRLRRTASGRPAAGCQDGPVPTTEPGDLFRGRAEAGRPDGPSPPAREADTGPIPRTVGAAARRGAAPPPASHTGPSVLDGAPPKPAGHRAGRRRRFGRGNRPRRTGPRARRGARARPRPGRTGRAPGAGCSSPRCWCRARWPPWSVWCCCGRPAGCPPTTPSASNRYTPTSTATRAAECSPGDGDGDGCVALVVRMADGPLPGRDLVQIVPVETGLAAVRASATGWCWAGRAATPTTPAPTRSSTSSAASSLLWLAVAFAGRGAGAGPLAGAGRARRAGAELRGAAGVRAARRSWPGTIRSRWPSSAPA